MSNLAQAVAEVYAEVDAAVAAAKPRCDASGRCCRFEEYGHTLFLSQFEADILLAAAPHYEKPVSRAGCPFQIDGLCTAREVRPLGCRIYFCDPTYAGRGEEITEMAIARLKRIADEHGTGWQYAPLHLFLNEATPRPAAEMKTTPTPSSRMTLPLVDGDNKTE